MRKLIFIWAASVVLGVSIAQWGRADGEPSSRGSVERPLPSFCDRLLTAGGHPLIKKGDTAVYVLVDGYSTGSRMPAELRALAAARGITLKIIHVHSHGKAPSDFAGSWKPENFDDSLSLPGDRAPTIAEAKVYVEQYLKRTGGVLIDVDRGAEPGVWFGSELRSALSRHRIPNGGLEFLWRNKSLQQKAMRDASLPSIRELAIKKGDSLETLQNWLANEGLMTDGLCDLAVKPTEGGGTRGFHRVRTWAELRDAIEKNFDDKTSSGDPVRELVVQEFLEGEEYSVQTVSLRHPRTGVYTVTTEVYRHHKRLSDDGKAVIYWKDEILDANDPVAQLLIGFDASMRKALKVKTGAAHPEYRFKKKGEFTWDNLRLLELNYRLIGAQHSALTEAAMPGWGQHVVLARAALDPAAFFATPEVYQVGTERPFCYMLKTSGRPGMRLRQDAEAYLQSKVEGIIRSGWYQKGDKELVPTINLPTALGEIWVVGTQAQVDRAAEILETIERNGELEVAR